MRILIDDELNSNEVLRAYAGKHIRWFVENVSVLYGPEYITYNFHVTTHLPKCSEIFGTLDKFSAFSFENHLHKVKGLVKTSSRPLHQLVNRISERNNKNPVSSYQKVYPALKSNVAGEVYLQFSGFRVSTKKTENCCLLKDGTIAIVKKIRNEHDTILLSIKHFEKSEPFFTRPCNSKKFSIVLVKEASLLVIRQITPSKIKRKRLKIQEKDNNFVIIPLLHENSIFAT